MPEPLLWQRAAALAARAHEHQLRRDGRTPYVAHAFRVAMVLAAEFGVTDPRLLAAALLHDAIEDCDVDYDEIAEEVGTDVADLVAVMTKDTRLPEPRREAAYERQIAEGPVEGRLLKLADVFDNLTDAATPEQKRKLLGKAETILGQSAGDASLGSARDRLSDLVRAVRAGLQ